MTRAEAQHVLIKAFIATKELPREIEAVLLLLIQATTPRRPDDIRRGF
jgi:hypothetical protein